MDGGTRRIYRLVVELDDKTTINVSSYSSLANASRRILAMAKEGSVGRVYDKHQSLVKRVIGKISINDLMKLETSTASTFTFRFNEKVPGVRSLKLVKFA